MEGYWKCGMVLKVNTPRALPVLVLGRLHLLQPPALARSGRGVAEEFGSPLPSLLPPVASVWRRRYKLG